jgi:hypothetical protein
VHVPTDGVTQAIVVFINMLNVVPIVRRLARVIVQHMLRNYTVSHVEILATGIALHQADHVAIRPIDTTVVITGIIGPNKKEFTCHTMSRIS